MKKNAIFILLALFFSSCAPLVRQNHEYIDRFINNLDSLSYFVQDTSLSVSYKYGNITFEKDSIRVHKYRTQLIEFYKNGFHVLRVDNGRFRETGKKLQSIVIQDNKTRKKFTFDFLEEEKGNWKFLNFYNLDIEKEGRRYAPTIVTPAE